MLVRCSCIARLDVPARAIFSSHAVFKREALGIMQLKNIVFINVVFFISVFECADSSVVIVQQRAPIIKVIHCSQIVHAL